MANEFINFASGMTILNPDDFCEHILKVWDDLRLEAEKYHALVKATPEDEELAAEGLKIVERFLAFGELMTCGNRLAFDRMEEMCKTALQTPNDPQSKRIIEMITGSDPHDDGSSRN